MINDYLSLSTRAGFNKSLSHFRMVSGIVDHLDKGENLADIIDKLEKSKKVEKAQIGPILNAIVIDRLAYSHLSFNLPVGLNEFEKICENLQGWNRLEVIVAYHHPQLGVNLINPKQIGHWEAIRELDRDELVVLYVQAIQEEDRALEAPALEAVRDLLVGKEVSDVKRFGGAKPKAPPAPPAAQETKAPAQSIPVVATPAVETAKPSSPEAPPSPPPSGSGKEQAHAKSEKAEPSAPRGKMRMTPKYSVQVSNELFHNGNVEAWKNIVESYMTKHPGVEVHIFHDGQKVNNINALFKWGRVKHGDVILFSVAGDEISGVAKLQRYLYEGASLRFENYLKKDVNKVLNLF